MSQEREGRKRGATNTTNSDIDIARVRDFCATPIDKLASQRCLSLLPPLAHNPSDFSLPSTHHNAGRSQVGAVRSFTSWTTQLTTPREAETNPRGIPRAPFVDRVEDYVTDRSEVESTINSFKEMISYAQDTTDPANRDLTMR